MFKSINRNIQIYYISSSLYYGANNIINVFLSLLITSKVTHGNLAYVGFSISYYMVIRAFAELPLSGRTADLPFYKKVRIVSFCYVFVGFILMFLGLASEIWQVVFCLTFMAILEAIAYPIKWNMFSNLQDKGEEELEWGMEDFVASMTIAVVSALSGVISLQYGVSWMFMLLGSIYITAGALFGLINKRKIQW